MPTLRDSFGRTVDDLRISLTDRCNFRCVYCMPEENIPWLPRREILSLEEIVRLARIFIDLGVRTIRLTGGEPTLRNGIERLAKALTSLRPDLDLAMTTNGFLLKERARPLAEAGLRRINVSLDTLRPERFQKIARRDAGWHHRVMEGLEAAREAGLRPIKVNMVVMRGHNEDEVVDFARLARDTGVEVRYIEFMPLDGDGVWSREQVVPGREILDRVGAEFPLQPVAHGPEPAKVYRFADGQGTVGVIASVTEPFCDTCNRIRLTADGQLRTCLFSIREHDVKSLLRSGGTDDEIADFILAAVWKKEPGHKINHPDFVRPRRAMYAIGG